jgi:hypothetical protein
MRATHLAHLILLDMIIEIKLTKSASYEASQYALVTKFAYL